MSSVFWAVTPYAAVSDPDLGSDAVRVLSAMHAMSGSDGSYAGSNAALAKASGLTPLMSRRGCEELLEKGWIEEVSVGGKKRWIPLQSPSPSARKPAPPLAADPKALFHPSNEAVSEAGVVHLITSFLDSRFGEGVTPSSAYSSPWQRKGAAALLRKRSVEDVKKMLADMGEHKDEDFAPEVGSLWALDQKWDKCVRFLRRQEQGGIERI